MKSTAHVTVTLVIDCTQPWGQEETLAKLFEQASREALDRVNKIFERNHDGISLKGKPVVTALLVPDRG